MHACLTATICVLNMKRLGCTATEYLSDIESYPSHPAEVISQNSFLSSFQ